MKKILALVLLLVLIVSLSACGKVEITLQEVYNSGTTENMLKNHQSVYVLDELDGEVWNERYITKDYIYDCIPDVEYDWIEFITHDASYCYLNGDYVYYLPVDPNGVKDDCASYFAERHDVVLLGEDTIDETVESISKKDGRITVASVMSEKTIEEMAEYGATGGKFEYGLDAKTRELVSIAADYTYDDGSTYHMTSEIIYDAEAPEMVKTFLEYTNQTENLRNITVVTNPGAENEISQSVQVAKGLIIGLRYDDEEYVFEVYSDAACTESYDPYEDTESDLTIYVKWVE